MDFIVMLYQRMFHLYLLKQNLYKKYSLFRIISINLANVNNAKQIISVLGCGWFGLPLARKLVESGFEVKGSVTQKSKLDLLSSYGIDAHQINLNDNTFSGSSFFKCDVLIICIPGSVKSADDNDYYYAVQKSLIYACKAKVKHVILISSIGVYTDVNTIVDERSLIKANDHKSKILLNTEELLNHQKDFTATIVRFGGLIGAQRNLAKYFAGKRQVPQGLAPINLIALQDCIGITLQIIEQKAFGYTYNAVCPHHPTRADFYTALAKNTGYEIPEFVCKKGTWKQVDSFNVPHILNYKFIVNNWFNWIAEQSINSL